MLEDSKLIYPHLSIIHYSPTWIDESKTTELALEWQSSLVSFYNSTSPKTRGLFDWKRFYLSIR